MRQLGFSLIEVLVALVLLMLFISGYISILNSNYRNSVLIYHKGIENIEAANEKE